MPPNFRHLREYLKMSSTLGKHESIDALLTSDSKHLTAAIAPLTKFHDLLITVRRLHWERQRLQSCLTWLLRMQVLRAIVEDSHSRLRNFETCTAEHVVNLLRNVLRSELLKVNKPILSKGLSSLLRLCLIYRMKSIISLVWNSWQSLMADLKKYGQYVLPAFDHRSDGVRNGVQTVFAQIWRQDIDWAFGFVGCDPDAPNSQESQFV